MKFSQAVFLFTMLGVASARVGDSVNESDQGETRNLEEEFIDIEFSVPTNTVVTPDGGVGTLATGMGGPIMVLGEPNDKIRVMVGYKNNEGKLKAIATEASELIKEFKNVNALTMTIPRGRLNGLANNPNIE
jgi:hypothetical protein